MKESIRARPWAGLDLGAFSVKLLAAQPGVGGMRYWVAESLLPQPADGADRLRAPEVVAQAIADCFARAGLHPRSFRGTSVGISGSDVIVKQITMPLLDDDEVGPALRFEARKHLPFELQDLIIDFQVLGRYASQKKLEVLLAACGQEHARRVCAPLDLLGIDVDILDAAPLALMNALVQGAESRREAFLLLDIGHTSSHLALYQRDEPFFSRRLDFGGLTLTRAIAEGIRVPFEEAEEWKLAAGSDQPGFRVDWDSPEMLAVHHCLRHDLVEELRRSFAFYGTLGQMPDPLKMWISGGSARLPGLAARLSEILGFPVLLFNPLERLGVSPRAGQLPPIAPQFAQAYGLALRTA
ncbi:MAG: hypothetical protein A2W00_05415 [Candidatus Eisenbacteria bacterium RBG_16_71_46]|nr:MAG: hypothetical protein A2W00_05415 [Candidatus Eisenbacteria bacterium RBG_16_71_46]OGF23988.1 MAG: hypothetical protein A2V63_03890 [Candidatus Eisenbacteria bacterium RBG_19FT_COMBO_70_11]